MANNGIRINDNISNPKLKKLLGEFKELHGKDDDAATAKLNELANELVFNAKVLVPVQLSKPPMQDNGVLTVPQGSQISFTLATDSEKHYLPIFTGNDETSDTTFISTGTHKITIDFNGIASIFENTASCFGLLINPFSDNLMLRREMILKWNEDAQIKQHGHARHTITADTPTEVYTLSPYPMIMSNKLCETAKSLPGVKAMWLRGIKLNGDDGYLLITDLSEDGNNGIFKALGECATPLLEGKALHIVTSDSDFAKKSIENILPIYTKNG